MRILQLTRTLRLGIALLLLTHGTEALAQMEISDSWNAHHASVSTARIHFLKTFIHSSSPVLSLEDAKTLVNQLQDVASYEFMSKFIEQFNPEVMGQFRKHDQSKLRWALWDDRILIDDGFNTRSTGEDDEHLITQGLHLTHNLLNHHVDCYTNGECRYFFHNKDWFLATPPQQALQDVIETLEADNTTTLTLPYGGRIVVDSESHLPIYQQINDSSGTVARATFLSEITTFPGDITLPARKVQFNFLDGKATGAFITMILDAEFNSPIPESSYELSMKQGGVLTDLRDQQRHSRRANGPVPDVVQYFLAASYRRSPPSAATPSDQLDWKSFILIANGLFLIGLGLLMWKRNR